MDEAAGAGAAAGRDERLGLAQVVADAAEGRRGAGRVRRRIGQLGQRGKGRADAVGDAAHVQRNGYLAEQKWEQSLWTLQSNGVVRMINARYLKSC